VESVDFSPDGKTLASAGHDKTILLWDVARRSRLATLHAHADIVQTVTFSPDGKSLASAGYEHTILLQPIDVVAAQKQSCAIAGRSLTQAEWKQFIPGEPYHKTCP
jgi:WD40 repeat protein